MYFRLRHDPRPAGVPVLLAMLATTPSAHARAALSR